MSSGGGLVKIAGVDKETLREYLDIEVDDAVWNEFKSRRNGALLGVGIAKDDELSGRYVWEVGKEFVLADMGEISMYFAGTFKPRDPTLRSVILTGDSFLQEVDNRLGKANQILVRIAHRDDASPVSDTIWDLETTPDLQASTQQAALDQAVTDLDDMLRYAGHVIFAMGIVIFLGLANATSMAVRERTREVGVLRALGFSRRKVLLLVAGESLGLAFLGGLIGCGVSWLVVELADASMRVGGFAFPVTVGLLLAFAGPVLSAVLGLVGGIPAGIRVSRQPIVESLRSVD